MNKVKKAVVGYKNKKPWFAVVEKKEYEGDEPFFYSRNEFGWVKLIEERAFHIKKEVEKVIRDSPERFNAYFADLVKEEKEKWITLPLKTWGINYHTAMNDFPETCKAMKNIPGVVSISFNMLCAQGEIPEHFGDTNATTRVHIGLSVPAELPLSGIKVGAQSKSWKEGEAIIFCDAHNHRAWNYSAKDRLILLVDVVRPEYMAYRRKICAIIVTSFLMQSAAIKIPAIKKFMTDRSVFFVAICSPVVGILIPVYNAFSFSMSRLFNLMNR